MPFTPYHFGLGVATKAALGRRFSFAIFAALQVVIDFESLYNLVRKSPRVHGFFHTFVGAAILALAAALVMFLLLPICVPTLRRRDWQLLLWLIANSLFATWSHVILDAIMHADVRPFWPLSSHNPLLRIIGLGSLHLFCVVAGFFGLMIVAFQWSLADSHSQE
jgi:membrane-bound metal-dependent hydrolase YbcI (DUF457 family)